MYSTCLFCHRDLGRNQIIASFGAGRRLAFDAARGRLWVVCRRCGRWNLSPLEERWEATEDCERLFRDARLRMSTDNMGLARLADGTELVRIGAPQRPELAAWRYGQQLGRRYRRYLIYTAASLGIGCAAVATGAYGVFLMVIPGGHLMYQLPAYVWTYRRKHGVVARTTTGSGARVLMRGMHVQRARLLPGARDSGEDSWILRVAHEEGTSDVRGVEAVRLAGRLLARINRVGGTPTLVRRAVERLEQEGSSERLIRRIAVNPARESSGLVQWWAGTGTDTADDPAGTLRSLAAADRLALEMATHEETERRALEGELGALEAAWREAEEVAAIADALTLPPSIEERLADYRLKTRPPMPASETQPPPIAPP